MRKSIAMVAGTLLFLTLVGCGGKQDGVRGNEVAGGGRLQGPSSFSNQKVDSAKKYPEKLELAWMNDFDEDQLGTEKLVDAQGCTVLGIVTIVEEKNGVYIIKCEDSTAPRLSGSPRKTTPSNVAQARRSLTVNGTETLRPLHNLVLETAGAELYGRIKSLHEKDKTLRLKCHLLRPITPDTVRLVIVDVSE